jgi:hypothetical protein
MRWINDLEDQNVPQYEVSTFNYKEVLTRLEAIYQERWQDYKLTMSVMGSKFQALGAALFHVIHPDVRMMFAIPQEYNAKNYSKGCAEMWKIDLKELTELRRQLSRVGSLEIENGS